MANKTEDVLYLFSRFINHAQTALNVPYSNIKEVFPNSPICFLDYTNYSDNNKMVEIRFDDEGVTLSCLFNEHEICDYSFLFFDNDKEIEVYINFMNKLFTFDLTENCWMLDSCSVSLRKMEKDLALMCC